MGGFTRGLITGTIIGAAMSMAFPNKRHSKFNKTIWNGKKVLRTASNIIENLMEM